MMDIPFVNLKAQYQSIKAEVLQAVHEVLESQQFRGGVELERFESEISQFIGVRHAIGVASGTDALVLALKVLGIQPGDEVITTPFSFIATASSIVLVGGTPVFADIEPNTFLLDPDRVENKITERTKVIIPVHLFGQCADMPKFKTLVSKYSLYLLEDSAQAIGASIEGRNAGQWGDVAGFSFYPTKNLGAMGEGGLVTTDNDDLADKVRLLRSHGARKTYHHELIGYNSHLHTLQSAILRVKLRYLPRWNEARQRIAQWYFDKLGDVAEIQLPCIQPGRVSVFHQFVIRIPNRDEAQQYLREHGIATAIFYPIPIHKQPCFSHYHSAQESYPEAEKASQEVLALPIYPELTEEQVSYIAETIKDFLTRKR